MGFFSKLQAAVTRVSYGKEAKLASGLEYLAIKDTLMNGKEVSMGDFLGDVCVVVNVASNQEPGQEPEITACIRLHGGVRERLVLFSKGDVNGANARPVFTYLKNVLPFKDGTTNVLWNFGKFLIDHEGNPVKRYGSQTEPMKMKADIEALLAKRNGEPTSHKIVAED